MHGEAWVNHAIQEADLLLAFGMRFDDRVTGNLATYATKAKKIHVDIDPAEIGKNVPVDVALIGDLREVLESLIPAMPREGHADWLARIAQVRGDVAVRDIQNLPDDGHLYAAHVIHDLWRVTGGNAVVVTDVGQHQMWEAQYYHHEQPRTLITSGGLGTMGFALPAAIGAKAARPDAEVWVVAGDGGFQMTLCELATLRQEGLKVNIAVVNNGYLGMVRQWQEFFYEKRYAATPLLSPDFAAVAHAYGLEGVAVSCRADVRPAIDAGPERRVGVPRRFPGRAGGLGVSHGAGGAGPRRNDPAAVAAGRNRSRCMITLVVEVENKPGVLTRVSSLMRRRSYNIESLTVGHTDVPGVSRMTIVVDTDRSGAARIAANLYKVVSVLRVDDITDRPSVLRDLALVKVKADASTRSGVMQIVDVYRARVVDVSTESLIVEITGTEDKIDSLVDVLEPYGVLEMVRTGRLAMARGNGSAKLEAVPSQERGTVADGTVAYSV